MESTFLVRCIAISKGKGSEYDNPSLELCQYSRLEDEDNLQVEVGRLHLSAGLELLQLVYNSQTAKERPEEGLSCGGRCWPHYM